MSGSLRKLLSLCLILAILLSLCSCNEVKTCEYYEYFNTVSTIQSYRNETDREFERNCAAVNTIISDYHKLFDIYYEYAGINNLATVNKKAGKEPVRVDEMLIDFLLYCKEIYTLTDGETNVMLGAVLKLWHAKRDAANKDPSKASLPTEQELQEASLHTSIDTLVIDRDACTVYISDPAASIDVGAIGKGYAAEKAKEELMRLGATSYVLNLGGNIVCIGAKPNADPWRTVLKDPNNTGEYAMTLFIDDISCVTSGNYERYYTVDGVRYHHLIDKDTLKPSCHFASVTVFANDSALADALSTALFCMSLAEGQRLIEKIGKIDVVWIDTNGNQYMTEGMSNYLSY